MATHAVGVFVYRSVMPVDAWQLFAWHERPDALRRLLPRRGVRIEAQSGGLRDGGRVVFSIGAGPCRVRWEARHHAYVRGRQFCDEQVRGPFAVWRHTHRVEPIAPARCVYEDAIEYALPGGVLVNAAMRPILERVLRRAFARRHRLVREQVAGAAAR